MGTKTGIDWTDATWNPIRGCSKISDGCKHCYAETMAARFCGEGLPYHGLIRNGRWSGDVRLVEPALDAPLRWQKPRRIFVNSMSDLFHEALPEFIIDQVFAVMLLAPRHTFQVLTKRPARMLEYLTYPALYQRVLDAASELRAKRPSLAQVGISDPTKFPPKWIHWGVSVENQQAADERIPLLLQCPAAARWVSMEPLLGAVDLSNYLRKTRTLHLKMDIAGAIRNKSFRGFTDNGRPMRPMDAEVELRRRLAAGEKYFQMCDCRDFDPQAGCKPIVNPRIDWVVVGGESGPHARPLHPDWSRSPRDQCKATGVPFFFKQHGEFVSVYDREVDDPGWNTAPTVGKEHLPGQWLNLAGGQGFHGERVQWMKRVGVKAAGNLLDGREYHMFPGVSWE